MKKLFLTLAILSAVIPAANAEVSPAIGRILGSMPEQGELVASASMMEYMADYCELSSATKKVIKGASLQVNKYAKGLMTQEDISEFRAKGVEMAKVEIREGAREDLCDPEVERDIQTEFPSMIKAELKRLRSLDKQR